MPRFQPWTRSVGGHRFRQVAEDASIQILERRKVLDYTHCTIKEACTQLRTAARGLLDPMVDADVESAYGDRDRDVIYVQGWRTATEEEVQAMRAEEEAVKAQRRRWEEVQVAALRQARPDLFKDQGDEG